MFDLDAQIRHWREEFLRDRAFDASDVDELESHLRELFETLRATDLSADEAFLITARRLGDQRELRTDYVRARSVGQQILRSRSIASGALIVVVIAALLVPIGVYAVADLISESGTWLIRAREGASLYVGQDGLHVEDGNAGLIYPDTSPGTVRICIRGLDVLRASRLGRNLAMGTHSQVMIS